jgi:hypothetical protein
MSTTIQSPNNDAPNTNYDKNKQGTGIGQDTPGRSTDRDMTDPNKPKTDNDQNRNKAGQQTGTGSSTSKETRPQ